MTPLKLALGQTRMFQTQDRTLDAGSSTCFHQVSSVLGTALSFSLGMASREGGGRLELPMAGAVVLQQTSVLMMCVQ